MMEHDRDLRKMLASQVWVILEGYVYTRAQGWDFMGIESNKVQNSGNSDPNLGGETLKNPSVSWIEGWLQLI